MSQEKPRVFSREFKLEAVRRIEAGENVSALARELTVKREILYRWRDAHRLGGPEALRLRGRPSKAEALAMVRARGVAGRRPGRSPLADRAAAAQGRAAAAGPGFFSANLAALRGAGPDQRGAWRERVFAQIEAMTRPQGDGPNDQAKAATKASAARLCALAGVNRADYYRRLEDHAPARQETALRDAIQRAVLDHRFYGYRRIGELLKRQGLQINRKKVLRLMREDNLLCLGKPRVFRPATTDSRHSWRIWPNLARRVRPTATDQLWVADITYVRLDEAFVYLAVILDAFSRKVVGWNMQDHLKASLALAALEMALAGRQAIPGGLIHHTDCGIQSACSGYIARLQAAGIQPSMSRAGCPYDNAMAESFMKTLKLEEVDACTYRDLADDRARIGEFLQKVYNPAAT